MPLPETGHRPPGCGHDLFNPVRASVLRFIHHLPGLFRAVVAAGVCDISLESHQLYVHLNGTRSKHPAIGRCRCGQDYLSLVRTLCLFADTLFRSHSDPIQT